MEQDHFKAIKDKTLVENQDTTSQSKKACFSSFFFIFFLVMLVELSYLCKDDYIYIGAFVYIVMLDIFDFLFVILCPTLRFASIYTLDWLASYYCVKTCSFVPTILNLFTLCVLLSSDVSINFVVPVEVSSLVYLIENI